jgi:hypothetical protein
MLQLKVTFCGTGDKREKSAKKESRGQAVKRGIRGQMVWQGRNYPPQREIVNSAS